MLRWVPPHAVVTMQVGAFDRPKSHTSTVTRHTSHTTPITPPTPLPLSQVGAFDRPECSNLRSFADDHRVVIAGGFFGGKTETVQHVARLYADTLQQQVTCDCLVTCDDCVTLQQLGEGPPGGMIDDDQLIWLGILCALPATSGP